MAHYTARLDLTQPRLGRRVHRSITVRPGADAAAISLHIGNAEMTVELTAAQVRELIGMLVGAEFELGCRVTEEAAS